MKFFGETTRNRGIFKQSWQFSPNRRLLRAKGPEKSTNSMGVSENISPRWPAPKLPRPSSGRSCRARRRRWCAARRNWWRRREERRNSRRRWKWSTLDETLGFWWFFGGRYCMIFWDYLWYFTWIRPKPMSELMIPVLIYDLDFNWLSADFANVLSRVDLWHLCFAFSFILFLPCAGDVKCLRMDYKDFQVDLQFLHLEVCGSPERTS